MHAEGLRIGAVRRRWLGCVWGLWLGLAVGPALAEAVRPVRAVDDRGVAVEMAVPPQRIVSLVPALTEALCTLGACDRLVGVDRWSNWPESVKALPKLGALDELQLESLVRLKPDLVLAYKSQRALDRLQALGIPALAMESQTHADIQRSLSVLGAVLGQAPAAELAWQQVQQQLRDAAQSVPPAWRGKAVYFEIGSAPYAAGADSFVGQTLAALGLSNVVQAHQGAFPKLNPEFVLKAQPDIVMATARELKAMPTRPGWQAMRALAEGRSCGFEPAQWDVLVRPGPRVGQAAQLLVSCLARLPQPVPARAAAGSEPRR